MVQKTSFFVIIFLFVVITGRTQTIPSVLLKDLNGTITDISSLSNEDKPFVIYFFALWCKPSLKEINNIKETYAEWQKETGVKVFLISTDSEEEISKVRTTVNDQSLPFNIFFDTEGKAKKAFNVNLIPAVFVCDKNGVITFSRTGYTEGAEKKLKEDIKKAASIR